MEQTFFCDVCNLKVFSLKFWDDHVNGFKHKQMVDKKRELEILANRSVHLNNFKEVYFFLKKIILFYFQEIKEELLLQIFDQFGEVDRVLIDKSGKNAYAIIEFEEEEAAKNLLGAMQRIKIGKVIFYNYFLTNKNV